MNAPNFICARIYNFNYLSTAYFEMAAFLLGGKRDLTHSLLHTHRSDCLRIDKAGYARPELTLSGGPYRYVQPEITPR